MLMKTKMELHSVIFIQLMAIMLQNGLAKIVLFAYASLALGWFMVKNIVQILLLETNVIFVS